MKKKIILIFIALLVFYMPLSIQHQQANAVAVISKAVNVSAKKIAKEAIKDTAVQMSMNFVMDYKYVPKDQRLPKTGYSFVCMPKDLKTGGDCAKVMEVKKLNAADKIILGSKVETVLESKIAGGIGSTRWGKFLNWLVPIFTIGLGVSVLDYAMNGEVSDLFDDIASESLKALGYLIPSANKPPSLVIEPGSIEPPLDDVPEVPVLTEPPVLKTNIPSDWEVSFTLVNGRYSTAELTLTPKDSTKKYVYKEKSSGQMKPVVQITYKLTAVYGYSKSWRMGEVDVTYFQSIGASNLVERITTGNTDFENFLIPSPSYNSWRDMTKNEQILALNSYQNIPEINIQGETPVDVEPIPEYDQLQIPRTNKANVPIKIVAPGAIPFTEKDTGEQLLPQKLPDGTTGFKTKTGTTIDEENVLVGDPVIIENPDGSKIVVKQPNISQPNPSPADNGNIPPIDTPIDTEFPDGPSCDAQLQLPKLLPLFTQISETFPFSIPWDLKSGFDAIFLKMGSEKPKFEYKLAFQGQEHDFSFKIPSFFDSWMPFIHSILLLTFDIGIVYAIYRFMKGGSG